MIADIRELMTLPNDPSHAVRIPRISYPVQNYMSDSNLSLTTFASCLVIDDISEFFNIFFHPEALSETRSNRNHKETTGGIDKINPLGYMDQMKIKNHKLSAPVSHKNQSPNKSGGTITPSIIVLHYTASGGEDGGGDAEYLSRASSRASAQVVVGRSGDAHQLMALNERAWHAGKSNYKGNTDVNSISIGIEIDNWGWLDASGKSHAGVQVPEEFQFKGTRNGHSLWEAYRDEQLQTVEAIIAAICDSYDIVDIVGHEDVSPGRKQDPGPALDEFMGRMKQKYLKTQPTPKAKAKAKRTLTTKVALNLRARPNRNAVVLTVMGKGSSVEFIEETYPGWFKLRFGNRVGWAVGKYLT